MHKNNITQVVTVTRVTVRGGGGGRSDRQKSLKLPTLTYRRIRGDTIESFSILNGHYDEDVSKVFLCLHKDVPNPWP